MMNEMTFPEMMAVLGPLLDVVFPTAGITVSLSKHHYIVIAWEDGPSIPQVEAACQPVHRSLIIFARRHTVENLRKVAIGTMRSYGVTTDGLRIKTQSNGAVLDSHRDVITRVGGPISLHIEREAGKTSFYVRPAEGKVLRESYDRLDIVSIYHPECYAYRLRPLTLQIMSGELIPTRDGTIQAIALREIDPRTQCDLIGCCRLIGEEAKIE
jgi:hypothetical protein